MYRFRFSWNHPRFAHSDAGDLAAVRKMYSYWADGKLAGSSCVAAAEQIALEDVVYDASSDAMPHVGGAKVPMVVMSSLMVWVCLLRGPPISGLGRVVQVAEPGVRENEVGGLKMVGVPLSTSEGLFESEYVAVG